MKEYFLEDVMFFKESEEKKKQIEIVGFGLSKGYNKFDEGSYIHDKLYSK